MTLLIDKLQPIKWRMQIGELTYEEAKVLAQPIIDKMNSEAIKIAKKYKGTHRPFTFTELMR